MLQAINPSANVPTGKGASLAAPVGGWNARDPIANMPATDAVFLDNFFPRPGDVQLRKGSTGFASVTAGQRLKTLMGYNAPDGTSKLFAAGQAGIYDVSAGGAVGAVASAATEAAWQFVNLSTAGGSFLWCCNAVDKARYFNGTAWTVLDGVSTPALTGVTSTDVANVSLFKSRLMLCVKDSLSFWYLPVNSVAGAASEFPLGAIFPRGGYLMATGTWTLDGGNGPDDYFVAVTSEGEVAVYAGTDPSNAATWALQGVYYIGTPIGRRCLLKFGGDLLLLTVRGLFPLSKALQSPTADTRSSISNKISNAWVDYAEQFKDYFGWQPVFFPEASMLLVNIPTLYDAGVNVQYSYQFVMNTQTRAWCRFLGMPSEAWLVHEGKLYFTQFNKINEAWTGQEDVDGYPIDGRVKTAFLYPSGRGNRTRATLARPIFSTSGSPLRVQMGIDTDYAEKDLVAGQISYGLTASLWDNVDWDEAVWTSSGIVANWRSIAHYPGRALSLRLRILGKGVTMSWNATDFVLQKGSML